MSPRVRLYVEQEAHAGGVSVGDLLGRTKMRSAAMARRRVMQRLRADGMAIAMIARQLGSNASTVRYHTDEAYRDRKLRLMCEWHKREEQW
jgi:DNA-binding NarL/FixJ family response regulator